MDERRFLLDAIQECDDIIVPACLNVIGALGSRLNL
jgi:hypothetical protein